MVDLSKLSDDELMALANQAKTAQNTRALSSLSDEELARVAAARPMPSPPPGVTIHTGKGDVYFDGQKYVKASPAETEARFNREAKGSISGDVGDAVLRGVPYAGPFFTRARALATDGDYATNLEREQAQASTFDRDFAKTAMAAKGGGAILGTVAAYPLTKFGGVTGRVARGAFGGPGSSTLATAVNGGAAGGLQGMAQGFGDSRDLTNLKEVTPNVMRDTAFGMGFGFGLPLLAAGGVGAYNYVKNKSDALPAEMPGKAGQWLVNQLGDPAKVSAYRKAMADLGPDAVLADVSPEMQGVAGAAASRPGSRGAVVETLNTRDAGKNARIGGAVTSEFGPDAIPSQVQAQIKEAKDALSPAYEAAFAKVKDAVDTAPIAKRLELLAAGKRGPAQEAASKVRDMLNFTGSNVLDGSPRTLHQVRVAIDGMMDGEVNRDVRAVLTEARKSIDAELAAKVPGIKPIDSAYADLSRQWEAFKTGQKTFETGRETVLRPSELAAKQTELVQPAGTAAGPPTSAGLDRLSQGARSEIERIVGTKANDVSALNTLLKGEGDWNRDKLRLLFGQEKADRVLKVLDAEQTFQNTRNSVVGNSPTEPRRQFNNLLDDIAGKQSGTPTSDTAVGLVKEGVKKLAAALSKGQGEERAAKTAEMLGRLSVSGGKEANVLLQAIMERSARQQTGGAIAGAASATSPALSRLLEAINDERARQQSPSK